MRPSVAFLTGVLLVLPASSDSNRAACEYWGPFSNLIDVSDYIARHEVLVRGGNVVNQRLVTTYWKATGFAVPIKYPASQPWNRADYDYRTDHLETRFVFHNVSQLLWTARATQGVLLYPGITAIPNKWGKEIACSIIEFDRILRDAVALKRKGLPIRGKLSVVVFGKAQKSR